MKTNGRKAPQQLGEMYHRFRPTCWEEVRGQEVAVNTLRELLDREEGFPHAVLLSGPSGCGKTTAAHIIKRELDCADGDFVDINAASDRGIDTIRAIQQRIGLAPLRGKSRIWVLEEAHQLVKKAGGDAQTALLRVLEKPPPHAYIILCTTDPNQLLQTILTRCYHVKFAGLQEDDLRDLVIDIGEKVGLDASGELADCIVSAANGSAREAVKLLDQVRGLETEEERIEAVQKADIKRNAFDVVKALVWERKTWPQIAKMILEMDDGEDWERLRRLVLSCATAEILKPKGNHERAFLVLLEFEQPFHYSDKAGFVRACYAVSREK